MKYLFIIFFAIGLAACESFSPPPTLSPEVVRGRAVFESYCSRCHGTVGETVVVGPSLAGIAVTGGERTAGMDARAYILESIKSPSKFVVDGFEQGVMPEDISDEISEEDLNGLVEYLMTLK